VQYSTEGLINNPSLVFVHGVFTDISGYEELINVLAEKYRVYAFDLPGHGKSSKLTSKTNLSTLLEDFILKLEIKNPTIIGHSVGAIFAAKYAATNKNIKELILLNPAGIKSYSELKILFKLFKATYFKSKSAIKNEPISKLEKLITTKNIARDILNIQFWKQFFKLNRTNQSKDLKKIECKTKILWGKFDSIYPETYLDKYKKNLKNIEVHFINGGHSWPKRKPNLITKHL